MLYGMSPKYAQRQEVRFLTHIPMSDPHLSLSPDQTHHQIVKFPTCVSAPAGLTAK